jgi:hypothetical protein
MLGSSGTAIDLACARLVKPSKSLLIVYLEVVGILIWYYP